MNAMHPTGKQGRTAPSASSRLPQRPHPAFTGTLCPPCLPGPAPVGTLLTWILTNIGREGNELGSPCIYPLTASLTNVVADLKYSSSIVGLHLGERRRVPGVTARTRAPYRLLITAAYPWRAAPLLWAIRFLTLRISSMTWPCRSSTRIMWSPGSMMNFTLSFTSDTFDQRRTVCVRRRFHVFMADSAAAMDVPRCSRCGMEPSKYCTPHATLHTIRRRQF